MKNSHDELIISLVGNSRIGKSSIIERYATKQHTETYSMTIGMNSTSVNQVMNDKTISVVINDYPGGTGDFRPMPRSYFHCDGILLCFDLTNKNSFQKLDFWIDLIYKNKYENTVWLIGNKSDLKHSQEIMQEEIQSFAMKHQLNYAEVSSKTGDSICETFEEFINQLSLHRNSNNVAIHNDENQPGCLIS